MTIARVGIPPAAWPVWEALFAGRLPEETWEQFYARYRALDKAPWYHLGRFRWVVHDYVPAFPEVLETYGPAIGRAMISRPVFQHLPHRANGVKVTNEGRGATVARYITPLTAEAYLCAAWVAAGRPDEF